MEQYLNKSALVAEIKTRIETYKKCYANGDDCRADALETFLHDIDTLEVKEVDLKSEIERLIKSYSPIWSSEGKYRVEAYKEVLDIIKKVKV